MYFRSTNVLRGAAMLTFPLLIVAMAIAQTNTFPQTETVTPSETVLYSFCSLANCSDGYLPSGELIRDTKGNLYSTTYYGGTGNCLFDGGCGTVFKVSPNGTERALHSFAFGGRDGYNPEARLLADAKGNLYS